MKYNKFYSELGKLLYAVADADGVITKQEKQALLNIVREELVPKDQHADAFGTDAAWYTQIEFEILEESGADAETAFHSFIDYVENHHSAFDSKMIKACLRVAGELASAYHGTNKKEKTLLHQLDQKLKKIKFRESKNSHH